MSKSTIDKYFAVLRDKGFQKYSRAVRNSLLLLPFPKSTSPFKSQSCPNTLVASAVIVIHGGPVDHSHEARGWLTPKNQDHVGDTIES
jgi:hypothetical protein